MPTPTNGPAITGTLLAVCLSPRPQESPAARLGSTGIGKGPVPGPVQIDELGLVGDHIVDTKHHGGIEQAVYAYAESEARRWSAELGRPLPPGWFGENLRVDGIDVTDALIGERWQVGTDGLVLEVTIPRTPCRTFAHRSGEPRWVARFAERGDTGAYLRIIRPGAAQSGDQIVILSRPESDLTIRDVVLGRNSHGLRAYLDSAKLSTKVRRDLTRALARSQVIGET